MNEKALIKATESAAIELTPATVKRYINQYASDQEIALFLNQCVMFGLNPFKREIYLIKYSANQPATFVVGYEVYLKRAERSEKWGGLESGTATDGKDLKAWAKVYRKDWAAPLYHEVYLDEYIQKKQDGTPTRFWAEKPRTMLKKVAISQAFRMAFPDEFAGMPYTVEEMPVDHAKLPIAEVKVDPAPAVADPAFEPQPEEKIEPRMRRLSGGIKAMIGLGMTEEQIFTGIIKEVAEKCNGQKFAEISELNGPELDIVVDYLTRWFKHVKAGKKAAAAKHESEDADKAGDAEGYGL